MFQRTLLRQVQAARSVLATSSSTSSAPLALRRTSQFQTRLPAAVRPFAPQPFARSYSTENKEAEATETAEAEDPVKKQLEAKEKEVIELKVFTYFLPSTSLATSLLLHLCATQSLICLLL